MKNLVVLISFGQFYMHGKVKWFFFIDLALQCETIHQLGRSRLVLTVAQALQPA